ncbi:VOC family protein [Streptosporangium sp. NPDC050855]|uniref:VOC family protein n=1 Tax=Streptosporangium sp. NPDC050855 TaxID=3366194 RepID=UPI0037A996A2
MAVHFNHTIVFSRDRQVSAEFLAHILGLKVGRQWGPFLPVETANGVTLDFATSDQETITEHHYAFLVGEDEFDEILGRVKAAGVTYYPDPRLSRPNEINHNDGGRGFYFLDPDGHGMEVITVPYGGW